MIAHVYADSNRSSTILNPLPVKEPLLGGGFIVMFAMRRVEWCAREGSVSVTMDAMSHRTPPWTKNRWVASQ